MTVKVNGISLYYETVGSGRPLIMLHGNGEDHTIFDEAAEKLKDRFCVYLIDSRGQGKSSPVNEYHYVDMADDVVAFIKKLGLEDVALYGYSDGGIIGLLAAAECGGITGLIVSGANLDPDGLKERYRLLFKTEYPFKKDPLIKLMLDEPDVPDGILKKITAKTLVTAGEDDLIKEEQTRHIAETVKNGH